jgi:small subunit ribosomal protein S17
MSKDITGIVSSAKTAKTIVVSVTSRRTHPLYKKQYSISKKFMAHDENSEAHTGDRVLITASRPLSARKRWTLVKVLEKARVAHVEPEEVPSETVENAA